MHEKIVILDFGGQYAHLIASRIRREQVLSEIHLPDEISAEKLADPSIKGIILSGGPQSVYESDSPKCDPAIFELGKPVLGICYGHQFMSQALGGTVKPGTNGGGEYGRAELTHDDTCPLMKKIPRKSPFWMSHGDEVSALPIGFQSAGKTDLCHQAVIWHPEKKLYGIQFHPEVTHSKHGTQVLKNFLEICDVNGDWTIEKFLEEKSAELLAKIGDKTVFLFVSGGVDSTVCFAFLSRILGPDRVKGLFVDTGLLRQGEVAFVETALRAIGTNLTVLREADRFLGNLTGKTDPEEKRSIIGNTFLDVQRDYFATHSLGDSAILAQGTIYPDTIESGGTKHASKIKTHHNRVPEIQKMIDAGKVIEPVADLYKDEVRTLGELLGLPRALVWRHPFPGPGLGVRILCSDETVNKSLEIEKNEKISAEYSVLPIKSVGVQGDFRTYRHPAVIGLEDELQAYELTDLEKMATQLINSDPNVNRAMICLGSNSDCATAQVSATTLTKDRVNILQTADHIVTQKLLDMNLYNAIWQFPVVLIPIGFDEEGKESIVLRPIDSIDAMSATVGKLPWDFFTEISAEILEMPEISAVFLDVTSKPPGTIEWE